MKATFVGVNSAFSHSSLAVYYLLMNSLPDSWEGTVKEYNINMLFGDVISDLVKEKSEVYLFSCYIWNIEYILKIISSLKKVKDCTIVLGGSEVSFSAEKYFKENSAIDYIVAGEGERKAYLLLKAIENKEEINEQNIFCKNSINYEYKIEEENFDEIKFPYENIDLEKFKNRIIYYESSRGCPFRCSYCLSHLDKKVRFRSIDKVKRELLFFIENDIPLVKFIDRTFNADEKRTNEIISFIIENNKNTRFHFEICPDLLKESTLMLLKKAPKGMFQIEVGIQTINEKTLKEINRKANRDIVEKAISEIKKYNNIHVHTDLIAGLPFENLDSFKESFDFVYSLNSDMLQLGFLKVLDGTNMRKKSEEYKIVFSDYSPYEVLKTQWISFEELTLLKEIEDIVDKVYNTTLYRKTLNVFVKKPFDFFEGLNNFIRSDSSIIYPVGKEKYYKIIFDYLISIGEDKTIAANILSYDYLLNHKRIPPGHITENINAEQLKKEDIFKYLKANDITGKNLPAKEVYKKVIIFNFDINISTLYKQECKYLFLYDDETVKCQLI